MNRILHLAAPIAAGFLLAAPAAPAALGPHAHAPAVRSSDELEAKYREKLAADFVEHGAWVTDYAEARARAKAEGKVLFTYFSRSYAP